MFTLEGLSLRLILLPFLAVVITIHEFSHSFAAYKLGDSTAKMSGRLTLNPLAHLDKFGTLALLFFGIGWGKPVPFNIYNLKNPKRDQALIAFAGPFSNLLMALALSFVYKISPGGVMSSAVFMLVQLNLILAFFNLLPIEPLDGFKVVLGFLPNRLAGDWLETQKYGLYILIFLIVTGVVEKVVFAPVNLILRWIL
ncbi:MAG: site-2 protease family protein [Patescibacteria group bacterium]|nr:site-2 protease family protein [Patescibacteria group bacterium]